MGLEPTTSTLPVWRAPNCANAPFAAIKYLTAGFAFPVRYYYNILRSKCPPLFLLLFNYGKLICKHISVSSFLSFLCIIPHLLS